jgi:hypothetical protein
MNTFTTASYIDEEQPAETAVIVEEYTNGQNTEEKLLYRYSLEKIYGASEFKKLSHKYFRILAVINGKGKLAYYTPTDDGKEGILLPMLAGDVAENRCEVKAVIWPNSQPYMIVNLTYKSSKVKGRIVLKEIIPPTGLYVPPGTTRLYWNLDFKKVNISGGIVTVTRDNKVMKVEGPALINGPPSVLLNVVSFEITKHVLKRTCKSCDKVEDKKGLFKVCSACKRTYYCSRECQVANWNKHKEVCGNNGHTKIDATKKDIDAYVRGGITALSPL